jgi:hypothetical protein
MPGAGVLASCFSLLALLAAPTGLLGQEHDGAEFMRVLGTLTTEERVRVVQQKKTCGAARAAAGSLTS